MLPLPATPEEAPAAAAAENLAAPHELGNVPLPPDVAARLLAQAAHATHVGILGGVSDPPAQFLGANPGNTRLTLPHLCQRFIDHDWQLAAVPPRHGVVYAFRNQAEVPLAEPTPGGAAGPGWKGFFAGKASWTRGYLSHGFLKAQATFKSRDGRFKVRAGHQAGPEEGVEAGHQAGPSSDRIGPQAGHQARPCLALCSVCSLQFPWQLQLQGLPTYTCIRTCQTRQHFSPSPQPPAVQALLHTVFP